MALKFLFMYTLLTFSLSFNGIFSAGIKYSVTNIVPNTPDGIKFTKEIGIPYTHEILPKITNYVWSTILQQNNPSDRKPVNTIDVFIGKLDTGVAGQTVGNNITMNSDIMHVWKPEGKYDVKWYFTSVMYHEVTHVLQWIDLENCPVNLTEGIAAYTQIKSNYIRPGYLQPGEGNNWDQGYAYTARFLEYCDELVPGFVAKLNKKIRNKCNVSYFKDLTGKPVEQLWKDYKAKYGKKI